MPWPVDLWPEVTPVMPPALILNDVIAGAGRACRLITFASSDGWRNPAHAHLSFRFRLAYVVDDRNMTRWELGLAVGRVDCDWRVGGRVKWKIACGWSADVHRAPEKHGSVHGVIHNYWATYQYISARHVNHMVCSHENFQARTGNNAV